MTNVNDLTDWTSPDLGGDGDWSKYTPQLALIGVAALRWLWDNRYQEEIQRVKVQHEKDKNAMEQILEREKESWYRQRDIGNQRNKYKQTLERENLWQQNATDMLSEIEEDLVERQHIFCSPKIHRQHRLEIERQLLRKAVKEPLSEKLNIKADLEDIFKNDQHCASCMNTDKRNNGRLMWVYFRYWKDKIELQKCKQVEAFLKQQFDLK